MTLQISENRNKRTRICKIAYAFASDLQINNYPGDSIQVIGDFEYISFSSADFSEISEANGEQFQQELIIEIKGNNPEAQSQISEMISKYCILKLEFTNDEILVVGTGESPVMLVHERSGTPAVNKLSVSRYSAEKAKYLLS